MPRGDRSAWAAQPEPGLQAPPSMPWPIRLPMQWLYYDFVRTSDNFDIQLRKALVLCISCASVLSILSGILALVDLNKHAQARQRDLALVTAVASLCGTIVLAQCCYARWSRTATALLLDTMIGQMEARVLLQALCFTDGGYGQIALHIAMASVLAGTPARWIHYVVCFAVAGIHAYNNAVVDHLHENSWPLLVFAESSSTAGGPTGIPGQDSAAYQSEGKASTLQLLDVDERFASVFGLLLLFTVAMVMVCFVRDNQQHLVDRSNRTAEMAAIVSTFLGQYKTELAQVVLAAATDGCETAQKMCGTSAVLYGTDASLNNNNNNVTSMNSAAPYRQGMGASCTADDSPGSVGGTTAAPAGGVSSPNWPLLLANELSEEQNAQVERLRSSGADPQLVAALSAIAGSLEHYREYLPNWVGSDAAALVASGKLPDDEDDDDEDGPGALRRPRETDSVSAVSHRYRKAPSRGGSSGGSLPLVPSLSRSRLSQDRGGGRRRSSARPAAPGDNGNDDDGDDGAGLPTAAEQAPQTPLGGTGGERSPTSGKPLTTLVSQAPHHHQQHQSLSRSPPAAGGSWSFNQNEPPSPAGPFGTGDSPRLPQFQPDYVLQASSPALPHHHAANDDTKVLAVARAKVFFRPAQPLGRAAFARWASDFVDAVHAAARATAAALHSFVGDTIEVTWNAATATPNPAVKAARFFARLRRIAVETSTVVCGAAMCEEAHVIMAGRSARKALLVSTRWNDAFDTLATLGRLHGALLLDEVCAESCPAEAEIAGVSALRVIDWARYPEPPAPHATRGRSSIMVPMLPPSNPPTRLLRAFAVVGDETGDSWLYVIASEQPDAQNRARNHITSALDACLDGRCVDAMQLLEHVPPTVLQEVPLARQLRDAADRSCADPARFLDNLLMESASMNQVWTASASMNVGP